MSGKRNTKKTTSKTQAKKEAIVKEAEVKAEVVEEVIADKKAVDLDQMVEDKKTTGTGFQAYMRDCIKEGKVL